MAISTLHNGPHVKYVGVICVVLCVLQLLPIRFISQQSSCCISKPMMKHVQKPGLKSDLPSFKYGSQKCMFVDFFLTIYVLELFPIVFTIKCCRLVTSKPISFKHVLFMMFALWSSLNHMPIKHRGLIKKLSQLRPMYVPCYHHVSPESLATCQHDVILEMADVDSRPKLTWFELWVF